MAPDETGIEQFRIGFGRKPPRGRKFNRNTSAGVMSHEICIVRKSRTASSGVALASGFQKTSQTHIGIQNVIDQPVV